MSTAERSLVDDGTVAASINASGFVGIDGRRRRFGYNPGIYRMEMDSRESGRQRPLIPDGILLQFKTATLTAENFDINVPVGEYVKQVPRDFTAEWFIKNVLIRYEVDGFRQLDSLTMLEDPEAREYFNALHPSFEEIGHECPYDLTTCVTCRLALIGEDEDSVSDVIRERMESLPNPELASNLLANLRDACVTYRDRSVEKWSSLLGEIAKRKSGEPGIANLGAAEDHVRRHIHENRLEDQSAITAASYGEAGAQAQREGFKEIADAFRESKSNTSDELLARIAENQQTLQERQSKSEEVLAQTGQLLAALLEKVTKPEAALPEPEKVTTRPKK